MRTCCVPNRAFACMFMRVFPLDTMRAVSVGFGLSTAFLFKSQHGQAKRLLHITAQEEKLCQGLHENQEQNSKVFKDKSLKFQPS